MSVYPIQGINYFNYSVAAYYGSDSQNAAFKNLLQQYGIEASGNKEYDTKLLQIAMALETQEAEEEAATTESRADRPWADLMWQLGLTLNEDPNQDYDDIIAELDRRISSVTSDEERAELEELKAYADELFTQSVSVTSNAISDMFVGANMLAAMNRLMIVGLT